MSSDSDWFQRLEQQLGQQLETFLRDNPAQQQLLRDQERRERQHRIKQRRLELQASGETLRAELLQLASDIGQWQERVQRARNAGANELAARAETHLAGLMGRGRDRWQALGELGAALHQVENELNRLHQEPSSSRAPEPQDLDQAWSDFETEQELEQLRRHQAQKG
jgi:hercynine metabolism protein